MQAFARGAWRRVTLLLLVIANAAHAGEGGAPEASRVPPDGVRILDPNSAWAVRRALAGAYGKLARPGCQRIFSDFKDRDGRPLQAALNAASLKNPDYLSSLLFYDGSRHPFCRNGHTFAIARPGSPAVLVCTARFRDLAVRDSRTAEAILIHESLHVLGLGEDPPTSAEITFRVMARCHP